jgi:hypothetical protein
MCHPSPCCRIGIHPDTVQDPNDDDIYDYYGQGSIVAALAVGRVGVVPQANLISVKLLTGGSEHILRVSNYGNALVTTLSSIVRKKQNKAVISLALRKYIYSQRSDLSAV